MESHDLNSDEGLDGLLKAAKPAPLHDSNFTASVVAHLPAPAAKPAVDWTTWAVGGALVLGILLAVINPTSGHQVREAATQVSGSLSSSWNAIGLAFALLVGLWTLFGDFGGEESRD